MSAQAARIQFAVNSSNSAPLLYQVSNPNLATGGFTYEIAVAIADDLTHDFTILTIPRGEIAKSIIDGTADLACHISANWLHDFKNEIEWSKPLYGYANVLVAKKTIPFNRIGILNNASVGTVNNFVYTDLTNKFKNKTITRVDSPTAAISVKKLLDGKVDYVVMSDIEFNYYKKLYPEIQRSSFAMDKTNIQCALSKKSSITISRLNQSIDRLKNKQVFQKIYNRYLDPTTTPIPILYGFNDSNSPPFVFSDNSTRPPTVTGGLFFDLALAVGKKLNRPLKFILLPRNRLDSSLASGDVELICYNAEEWVGKYAKDYNWSIPIFKQSNYVVSNRITTNNIKMKSLDDLKGKTIGTALGFVYPGLTKYFKEGSVKREDVLSGSANIAKLNAQRIQFIILNNLEYVYYKKKYPDLTRAPFEIDPITVKCAASKKSNLKIEDVNTALKELMKSDQLQRILIKQKE